MIKKLVVILLVLCIATAAILYRVNTKPVAIVYDNMKIYKKDIKALAVDNNISFEEALELKINSLIEMKEVDKYSISINDEYIEELIHELEEHQPEVYSAIVKKMPLEQYKKNLKEHHMRIELFNIITKDYVKTIDTSDKSLKDWLQHNGISNYTEEEFENLKTRIVEKLIAEKSKEYYNKWLADERDTRSKRI